MKNIHILPTDKPSRIYMNLGQLFLEQEYSTSKGESLNHNIYITSDEEIKDCYYFNSKDNAVRKNNNLNHPYHHKIILTTDQDLIKDGVQAIDNEFLEWFVKNPSCEEVNVREWLDAGHSYGYKIIIPKEEPLTYEEFIEKASKELLDKFEEEANKGSEDGDFDNFYYGNCNYWEDRLKEEPKPFKDMLPLTKVQWEKFKKNPIPNKKEEPKQETLEEAIEKELKNHFFSNISEIKQAEYFINFGAKWQAERMYSEEDMIRFANIYSNLDIDELHLKYFNNLPRFKK